MADAQLNIKAGTSGNPFEHHIWDFTKYGYTLVSLIVGYDLGLFEILRNATVPLTSIEIAESGGLKERYVREWLGAVTAAQVIKVEIKDGVCRYNLTKENYDMIISSVTYGRGILGCIGRLDVTESYFKKEGPLGDPEAFDEHFWGFFGQLRERESITVFQHEVFSKVETIEDFRKEMNKGCKVLDMGCGNGTITNKFAERYPNSFFTGLDVSEDALKEARAKSGGIHNVQYKHGNPDELYSDLNNAFDVVFLFAVLHNLPDPLRMIENVQKLLNPHGYLLLIELRRNSNHTENVGNLAIAMHYTLSQFYCLPCSLSDKPYIGYGVGWGNEAMLKELSKHFSLVARFSLSNYENLYCLTRNP